MEKFSVKKPLTIFVAVIAVLVLGVVAYFKMTPDLLPNMDFPYVVIVTAYPGATPEKVEAEVSKPMEQAMSTLEHIKEVSSTSSENVSMVMLEFEEAVNMDTIGVDIQQQIVTLSGSWDDMVATPYVLKINPSMLPVQVAALSMEGKDTIHLTEFMNDTLLKKLEGIPGVARITATGMIQQELHVILDQEQIDQANEKVAEAINKKLDEAAEELQTQKEELESSKKELENGQSQLSSGADAIVQGENKLRQEKNKLLAAQQELIAGKAALESAYETMKPLYDTATELEAAQSQAQQKLDDLLSLQNMGLEIADARIRIEALKAEIALLESQVDPEDPTADPEKQQELQEKKSQLIQLEAELATNEAAYNAGLLANGVTEESLAETIATAQATLYAARDALTVMDKLLESQNLDRSQLGAAVQEMETQITQLEEAQKQLEQGLLTIEDAEVMLEEQKLKGLVQMSSAAGQLAAGASSLEMALTQIESGFDTLEQSREVALEQADLNNIITMDMVSQILMAQNFAMPAGYVEEDGVNYMVSIGDEITELEVLQELLLFDMGMDGVDTIYLKDVAVVVLTDNRDETYAKLDGADGVMLSFEKQSTYATAETTKNINARFRELEEEYEGLKFVSLMDQGDYIYMVVESILKNLFLGAVFSVLILFLFLRDLRPSFITL